MKTKGKPAEIQLLTGLFFRLLPFQVLLIVINAVNGIVDSLYAVCQRIPDALRKSEALPAQF